MGNLMLWLLSAVNRVSGCVTAHSGRASARARVREQHHWGVGGIMQSRPRVIHCGYFALPYLPGRARSDRAGPRKGQTDPSRTDASRIWRKAEKERLAGNREATRPRSAVARRQHRFERLRPRQQRLP